MCKNNKLIIIGAGGHGRVLWDTARLLGYDSICFLDDSVTAPYVIGKTADFTKYIKTHGFFVAIGNNKIREKVQRDIEQGGAMVVNLIHPNAAVGSNVSFGKGIAVMAGAVINNGASLADGAIVNTCASVDHDCTVGAFSHISVGAHLAGTVSVGDGAMIGAGATVINNVNVCGGCTVGAGAVVIRDITESGTYVGVPAKRIDK